PYVIPLASIMVLTAVLRIEPARLRDALRRPGHILLVCGALLVGFPAMVALIAPRLGAEDWLTTGLVLAAAAPPISSAAAFAILVRIDAALVTAISLPATLLAPLTAWGVTSALPGLAAGVDVTALALRLGALILGAFGLAFAIRRLAGDAAVARAALPLDAAMVVFVSLIGIGVMHEVGLALRSDLAAWLTIFLATWALGLATCFAAVALFWRAGRDRALAAGLCGAVKNMAIMVAATLGAVEPRIALVVITAQLPIYTAPLILRPAFAALARAR
ncbi:MAG: hypothetical protein AAF192_22310, partial [Pseudomonadota bacterium]